MKLFICVVILCSTTFLFKYIYNTESVDTSIITEKTLYAGINSELNSLCNVDDYGVEVQVSDVEVVTESECDIEEDINISESDVDLLARAIWNECGILGSKGQYYCGSVILNRIEHEEFPNTLYEVLYDKGQYQIVDNGMINREAPQESYDIARDLLENGSVLPSNVVYQAQFQQGSEIYDIIGNTYFCTI